jgi:hypothetical protein
MDPRFQGIWKLALDSMTEDAPSETDLSSRSVEVMLYVSLTHRGAQGVGGAFFSVFASHFYISQPNFKNLQK